jgi:trans-L-3-hydroxyproline dehydratase
LLISLVEYENSHMKPPPPPRILRVVDMHAAGEPVRIVESGYPVLTGATLLDKRREARERFDHLRRRLLLEPRGHGGMYGVIPTPPTHPDAAIAVLFTHQEGYSTMCGHATVALGRWLVDCGVVQSSGNSAAFGIEAPCGLVRVEVLPGTAQAPLVAFESVPSFASHLDQTADVAGYGRVRFDIAFGGAYYVILPASRLDLPLMTTPLGELVRAGVAVTDAVRATLTIRHPAAPDLGFLYGTILTDDTELGARGNDPSYNLCIFAEGQIDRSPTGSGLAARFALAAARGEIAVGQSREVRGVSGQGFHGTLAAVESTPGGVMARVRVAGHAYYTARSEFMAEPQDPFANGFELPRRFGDL